MTVKVEKTLSQVGDDFDFLQQYSIKAACICFNITARFVDLIQQSHLFFYNADDFVYVATMTVDQLLFLLKNLFD